MIKINLLVKNLGLQKNIVKSIQDSTLSKYFEYELVDDKYINNSDSNDSLIIFSEINNINDIKSTLCSKIKSNADSIIYISSNNDLVFDCLSTKPLNFIRLNNYDHDFSESIDLLIKLLKNKNHTLTFKTPNSLIILNTENIIYVESFGHYITIHCTSGQYKVREKISSMQDDLGHANFIRIHKSYIINKKYIKEVFTNRLLLTDDSEIPIGKSYKESLLKILLLNSSL